MSSFDFKKTAREFLAQHLATRTGIVGLFGLVLLVATGIGAWLNWSSIFEAISGTFSRHPWVVWLSLAGISTASFFYSAHESKQHADAVASVARERMASVVNPLNAKLDLTTSLLRDYEVAALLQRAQTDADRAYSACLLLVKAFNEADPTHQPEFRRRYGEVILSVNGFGNLLLTLTDGEFRLSAPWATVGDSDGAPSEQTMPQSELSIWRQTSAFYQAASRDYGRYRDALDKRLNEQRAKLRSLSSSPPLDGEGDFAKRNREG